MEENPFSPPKAVVADVAPTTDTGVRFFAVSPVKLVVLSFCTLGIYQLYWFYKHWTLIRDHSEPDIIPWARAFFGIIWCYGCFVFIRKEAEQLGIEPKLPAGPLAFGWVAASLAWRLQGRYFLLGFLAPLMLVPVQRHVNRINALVAPDYDRNARFSVWNWLALAAPVIFVVLILFSLAHLGNGM